MTECSHPSIDIRAIATVLAQQDDVVVGYLFGSVARKQAMPFSDVDIAVLLDVDLDRRAMLQRALDLVEALEPYTDCEIQLVLLNDANPLLAYEVIRDGIRLSERSEAERVTFEVRTMKRYFDVQPMLTFQEQQLFEQIQEVGLGRTPRRDSSSIEAAERLLARLAKSSER